MFPNEEQLPDSEREEKEKMGFLLNLIVYSAQEFDKWSWILNEITYNHVYFN